MWKNTGTSQINGKLKWNYNKTYSQLIRECLKKKKTTVNEHIHKTWVCTISQNEFLQHGRKAAPYSFSASFFPWLEPEDICLFACLPDFKAIEHFLWARHCAKDFTNIYHHFINVKTAERKNNPLKNTELVSSNARNWTQVHPPKSKCSTSPCRVRPFLPTLQWHLATYPHPHTLPDLLSRIPL